MTNTKKSTTKRPKLRRRGNFAGTPPGQPIGPQPMSKQWVSLPSYSTDVGGQRFATVRNSGMRITSHNDSSTLEMERTEAFGTVTASSTAGAFQSVGRFFYPMSTFLSWLRNFANSYSSYEILRLEFTYVPSVPTTTRGAVALAFFTDLRDILPTNMAQMLASEQSLYCPAYAGSDGGTFLQRFGAPTNNVVSFELPDHAIKYADGTPKMFKITTEAGFTAMQGTANVGDATVGLYCPGELIIATEGAETASQVFGQIFVRYHIRLKGPIQVSNQN